MDLTQLEMFNAVAEAGSITQAAAKVHRVPSNLTTRLRQLETELGVDLFIRENQRLRLSPAGHNFLRYSQQILALVDEARSVVAGDEPQGLFSLGSLVLRMNAGSKSLAPLKLSPLLFLPQKSPVFYGSAHEIPYLKFRPRLWTVTLFRWIIRYFTAIFSSSR